MVCLHGYHGREDDLTPLFEFLPLDRLVAVSVRGPMTVGERWAWTSYDLGLSELDASAQAVLDWLDGIQAPRTVAIAGFSQGGAAAIQALRHQPARFSCAALLAGFVVSRPVAGDVVLEKARPPAFSGYGLRDDVISPFRAATSEWLATHTSLSEASYPDLGHALGTDLVRDAAQFLAAHLLR